MKNAFFLFPFLLLASLLAAQELNPYMNMMHSSRCADGNLKVRWDDITGNFLGTQCFYSTNGGNWQNADVEQLEGLQLQALVPYNWGNVLRYRLRTELTYMNETLVYMQTPFLNADAFPPGYNAMGLIGTDATGDSITVYDDILDFTDSWCAATPNKLYSALANVAGSFPTMNSLTSYNVYATVIANPETVADTLAYAMLYTFNIPGVISPGLYKVTMDDTGMPFYERIGDIQSQVQGGKLYLACNLADLTGDPDFGPWPNLVNALTFTSVSMRAAYNLSTMEIEFGFGDYSTPALVIFQNNVYDHDMNALPQCQNLVVNEADNTVSFEYWDPNGDFPLTAQFVITDGPTIDLEPQSYDYSQNVVYTGVLPYLPQTGYVLLSDNGLDMVQYNYDGSAVEDGELAPPGLACQMDNPLRLGAAPFSIKLSGLNRSPLQVNVFNMRGQKLGTIYSGGVARDELEFRWDGKVNGSSLTSGIYFLRVLQDGRALARKFILTK